MSATIDDVTAIVVNYRTLEHTRACLRSWRGAYPTVPVLVIDNGSHDASTDYLREAAGLDPALSLTVNDTNVLHGPALHQGMMQVDTDYCFLLDSDTVVQRGGFLELLLRRFDEDPLLYAIGKRGWTDRYGYAPVDARQKHTAYVHPFAGLFDRRKYLRLAPFVHHGAPLYRNMWSARKAGYRLEHVDIEQYIEHLGKVTASVHGYGYGPRLEAQLALHRVESKLRRLAARAAGRPLRPPALPDEPTPGP
jgi:glycosyltransferase involved in cell wall biosynthesis